MPEDTETWIERFLEPRAPELVAPFREVQRIYSTAIASGELSKEGISRLLEYATSKRTALGPNVALILGRLSDAFPEARDAIKSMAKSRESHVRLNALVAIDQQGDASLQMELLEHALKDRSAKIRALAADKIMILGFRALLPALERSIANEKNWKLRTTLEWERDLLRDNVRIENTSSGDIYVTCRVDGELVSKTFSVSEMDVKGREWISKNVKE